MLRTQVQLTDEQVRRVRKVARREGVSLAEVVRRCVDAGLREQSRKELYDRAAELVGALADTETSGDLSRRHDAYLEEAFR
jgi:hypothetical protein